MGIDLGVEEGYAAARLVALNCVAELEAVCGDMRHVNSMLAARGTSDNAALYAKYLFEILLGIPTALA